MKPRIKKSKLKTPNNRWQCEGSGYIGFGLSPLIAYSEWNRHVLRNSFGIFKSLGYPFVDEDIKINLGGSRSEASKET